MDFEKKMFLIECGTVPVRGEVIHPNIIIYRTYGNYGSTSLLLLLSVQMGVILSLKWAR